MLQGEARRRILAVANLIKQEKHKHYRKSILRIAKVHYETRKGRGLWETVKKQETNKQNEIRDLTKWLICCWSHVCLDVIEWIDTFGHPCEGKECHHPTHNARDHSNRSVISEAIVARRDIEVGEQRHGNQPQYAWEKDPCVGYLNFRLASANVWQNAKTRDPCSHCPQNHHSPRCHKFRAIIMICKYRCHCRANTGNTTEITRYRITIARNTIRP